MKIQITQDQECPSPREWDNLSTMACWHKRYNLGDCHPSISSDEYRMEFVPSGSVVLPLYLYDHSGITISTQPFSCPWDSGRVGYIYATPETIRKEYGCQRISKKTRNRVRKILESEVKIYDAWLRGQTWYFEMFKEAVCDECGTVLKEDVDSCGGFIGDDLEETGMLYHVSEKYSDELKSAWDNRF